MPKTSEELISLMGHEIANVADKHWKEIQASESDMDHDRILMALALGASSAACGIIMEIIDKPFAQDVIMHCQRVVAEAPEVKRRRDN